MDHRLLTVYGSPFPKKRLGRDRDGGYVTVVLPNGYDLLLSAGLADDASFEDDWLKDHGGKCVAFDGTVGRCPSQKVSWIAKNVGPQNTDATDNLKSIIREHRAIFLKMDIEGSETPWLKSLDDELENVLQMVVEFHYQPYDETHAEVYEKINRTHALLHLHGNNFGGTALHDGVTMPVTFEATYVNRKALPPLEPNKEPLPGPHDKPNNPGGRDIDLNHPPFVF